jgi:hypothetical protein
MSTPEITQLSPTPVSLWNLVFRLVSSDWATVILKAWQLLSRISTEQTVGLYEVLDFDHELELCDPDGQRAIYRKRSTVRFLQDFVTSYQDQAWGLGNAFADYKCSPGVPVDRYRDGHKYRILISLRETKRRGETMKISIDRTVRGGFRNATGWSETEISHRTRHFVTSVIFPKSRPSKTAVLIEPNAGRTTPLKPSNIQILPDGRQRIFFETPKPVLFETYTLKWTW